MVECLRIFSELSLDYSDFDQTNINGDQKYLLELLKIIESNPNTSFKFNRNVTEESVNAALEKALKQSDTFNILKLDTSTVVFHGIHQFSPAILCAIEDVSKFKNVIFLFNYQEQYKSVYSTWLNIYSLFDLDIFVDNSNQFIPWPLLVYSYQSNLLADYIGKISEGKYDEHHDELDNLEVIQFESTTEFANYCAHIFEKAKEKAEEDGNRKPVLSYMYDQFYSPSKKVNDILRAYFPEQFGERHFLDYPIGHFFVSIMNMWDDETHEVVVNNPFDLKECLQSGIIVESNKGLLLNTFNNVSAYIEKDKKMTNIIDDLKRLKFRINMMAPGTDRIALFSTSQNDLDELIGGLTELNNIIKSFFTDFDQPGGFGSFYKKIQKFIVSKLSYMDDLDEEMLTVVKKLL